MYGINATRFMLGAIFALSVGGILCACGVQDDTHHMRDTTDHMSDTMDKMGKTMDGMNTSVAEMSDNIDRMQKRMDVLNENMLAVDRQIITLSDLSSYTYMDLRTGNAALAREKFLTSMDAATGMEAKISEAAKYLLSFEFQLWRGSSLSEDAPRDELFSEALQEFFADATRFTDPKDVAKTDVNPATLDNRKQNLYALAAVLDVLNYNQKRHAKTKDWQPVSMLDLIEQPLEVKSATGLSYAQVTLENQPMAIYLLQLRYNILSAIVLSRVSDIEMAGLLTKFKMRFSRWSADLSSQNEVQLNGTVNFLNLAGDCAAFLREIHVKPVLSSNIKALLKNMDFKTEDEDRDPRLISSLKKFQGEIP